MPRFGKDKDTSRKEELDRQAAEEVARLTRAGGPPGMGRMPGMGNAPMMPPSPLEQMAAEVADAPRPSQRRAPGPRKAAPRPQQAFTPMPSGGVGSSFGPGGLNPGPRMGGTAPPPPAFGGGAYDDDYGGPVSGPPVFNAEPDEDEEMTVTEMALMDHAARTGHRPEDLVMEYDASSAEEMRDIAMRKFYERQQARRPGASTNNPFAPAGMRGGSSGPAPRRNQDPAAAGGALAQRLANKRRREEEEARRARAAAEPAGAEPDEEPAADEGALARVLARRRQNLGMDDPAQGAEREAEAPVAPGRRHASSREASSPGLRSVPLQPVLDESAPSLEDMAASSPPRRATARSTKKAGAPKTAAKASKAPAKKKAAKASAAKAPPATKKAATKKAVTKKSPATKKLAADKVTPHKAAPAAKKAGKAKTLFCIECGEKNPAIAKFCFSCGTRLAAPET